jgi:hypothetical protein
MRVVAAAPSLPTPTVRLVDWACPIAPGEATGSAGSCLGVKWSPHSRRHNRAAGDREP